MKFNELPAGNYSTWDHGHSTPSRWTTFYTHIVISTDKITGSSSLSPTPSQTRAEPHSHICKSRCRTPGAQSCRAYTSPKSEPGSLWLMSWTCSLRPLRILWGSGARPVSGPSFDLTIEPELFRESEATLQMFQRRIVWESTGSVRRSDRAGRLRGDRRVMRAVHRESRGCSTEHRPRPGQRVDSPLISPAVTKWSRVQPANWLDPESGRTIHAATAQVVPTGLPKWCPFCL